MNVGLPLPLVVALTLFAAPHDATQSKLEVAAVRLGLLPTVVHGSDADRVAERLRSEVSGVLEPAEFELQKLDVVSSGEVGPYCADAVCWQGLANEHEVTHLVQLEVRFEDPDWQLEAIIVDGAQGTVVGQVATTCDLCGFDELAHAVADAAAGARRQLESSVIPAPVLAITSTPPGASVEIDGEAVGRTPVEATFEAGERNIKVSRSGFATERRRLALVDGVRYDLAVPMRPVSADDGATSGRPNRALVIAGATSLGTGFALLGVGIALVAIHEQPITRDCDGSNVDSEGDCRFVHNTQTGGIISLAIGGVAAAVGVALLVVERQRRRKSARAQAGPGGVLVRF